MKRRLILWSLLLLTAFQFGYAQPAKNEKQRTEAAAKAQEIRELVQSGDFIFEAQRMMPMRGGIMQLMGGYDLRVSQNEVRSFLPYFGRLYTMPMTPSDGPLRFESRQFNYKVTEKAKDRWEVEIAPKDVSSIQRMTLTIYDNGNANLQVLTNNRQPISFDGYVTA
jgi:hypothetical protein